MATIQNTTPHSQPHSQPVEKTLYEQSSQSQNFTAPAVNRTVLSDEGLPEVVISNQTTRKSEYYDAPIPVDSETDKRFNEAPIPVDPYDNSPPPLPARYSTGTPQYYSQGGYPPQQHQAQQHQGSGGYSPQLPPYSGNEVTTYITPLHELGDLPKFVDCPFCRRRVETRVKKKSSKMTHVSATVLGFTTIAGAAVPYAGNWACHLAHYCTNCGHKVALRKWGSKEMKALGTPDHLREVSRYPSADSSNRSGNLPYKTKPFEVEEILAKEGFSSLNKIHISIDPVSARNPGYCFVDFHDRETAEKALSSLNAVVYGRTLKVGPCEPKKPRRSFRDEGSTSRRWGDWNVRPSEGGVPIGKVNGKGEEKGPYWAIDHFEDMVRNPGGRRLYVGGLSKMVDQAQHQEELTRIFSGFKPTAIGKRITPHESKRTTPGNHHYCFVDFETKGEASSAVEALNGKEIPGGQLKVSVSERVPQKLVGRQLDAREGRRVGDRMNNTRPKRPDTNNATASNNWRRNY
ncbi:related to single-stranded DNA binding protein [Fusarium torulosum]|uniref:Related to single-stranded DNA binding protein n=1 Tax=Fusarium torulosum TaxID=33205 RepID=A0AAE8M107_9HYPO|nr:related to single-stranded DNA binding protein [Fusarium torulosum]